MDLQYDPERQAVAAMKLAAEADGPERQRWITAALAWSELSRLRGTAEHNGTKGGLCGSPSPVERAASPPPPFQAARLAFRAECDAAPVYDLESSLVRPEPPAGYASLVIGRLRWRALFGPCGKAAMLHRRERQGRARQASPGSEKLDVGGVVRGAGSGRSVPPGPAAPPLESYRLARSRRRRRVNGSAFSAIPRTRWARPR